MTKPNQPIKTTASAEIIKPEFPPLPECMLCVFEDDGWTVLRRGTRHDCEIRLQKCDASKTHALITIAPPVTKRTAASDDDLLADRKTLKDAVAMLRVYAKHHLWCRSHRDETQCDCGFRVVQEATDAE